MSIIKIPEKIYFKIGEVSRLLELEPYVLRYWETEFSSLKPEKTRTGQRSYRRQDIELLVSIRHLLHEELFTIAGARKRLKEMKKEGQKEPFEHVIEKLELEALRLKQELEPLKIALSPLQKRNDSLERENRAVKAAYAELEKTKDALVVASTKLDNESLDLAEVENKLIESRRIVGRQAGESVRMKRNNETLQEQLDISELSIAALQEKIAKLEVNQKDNEALLQLETRLETSLRTIANLESDNADVLRRASATRQKSTRVFLSLRRELETLMEAAN